MTAIIELLGYQKTAAGVGSIEFPIADGTTAMEALVYVAEKYPATYLDPERVMFNINGVRSQGETVLNAGDTITFLPILGGG